MKTYLINTITNDVEAGPGSLEQMTAAADVAIKDGASPDELVIATVTHGLLQPPAIAVVSADLANATPELTEIAQS